MDLLMLQSILCNCFQMSVNDVTQFVLELQGCDGEGNQHDFSKILLEQNIDGTNIVQVLNSMTSWTEGRSLMDKLEEGEFAIAWPCECETHDLLQEMLQTQNFMQIEVFMTNILNFIQAPLTSYIDIDASKRSFAIDNMTCFCKLYMFQNLTQDAMFNHYVCVMDITEGHVLCSHGRSSLKICFKKNAMDVDLAD